MALGRGETEHTGPRDMTRKSGHGGFTEEAKVWASRARRRDEKRALVDAVAADDAPIDLLNLAARTYCPVRVERDHPWWAADVNGFVVKVGKGWVVIQALSEGVFVDGYQVVRIEDITDVEEDREGGYIERAVTALGRPEPDFDLPENATTADALRAAANHSTLVSVHLERMDDSPLLVGYIAGVEEEKFDILLINPRGVWVDEPTTWSCKDITRIEVGDRYADALERFGEKRPSL